MPRTQDDELSSDELERLWLDEAARRYEQLRNETARAIPSEEVLARLESRARR